MFDSSCFEPSLDKRKENTSQSQFIKVTHDTQQHTRAFFLDGDTGHTHTHTRAYGVVYELLDLIYDLCPSLVNINVNFHVILEFSHGAVLLQFKAYYYQPVAFSLLSKKCSLL